jgi:predicted PurR-regulated permease PerM
MKSLANSYIAALIASDVNLWKDIILPILFSILLANLLLPIVNKLIHAFQPADIYSCLCLSIVIGMGILYLLTSQVMKFVDDVPALRERMNEVSHSIQVWFRQSTDITIRKQNQYIRDTVEDLKDKTPQLVGFTFCFSNGF